jgi:hypothetical protein
VDFKPTSYGFRPKRSATMALETLRKRGAKGGNHVLDADIRDYFGSIDHEKLMKLVSKRISDRRVLKLLKKWLEAGVMEEGRVADLNPVLRGWSNYFRTGNAARRFDQIDSYVGRRLKGFLRKRKGRALTMGDLERWDRSFFWSHGLHRLRGTVRYPEAA